MWPACLLRDGAVSRTPPPPWNKILIHAWKRSIETLMNETYFALVLKRSTSFRSRKMTRGCRRHTPVTGPRRRACSRWRKCKSKPPSSRPETPTVRSGATGSRLRPGPRQRRRARGGLRTSPRTSRGPPPPASRDGCDAAGSGTRRERAGIF